MKIENAFAGEAFDTEGWNLRMIMANEQFRESVLWLQPVLSLAFQIM